MIRPLLIVFIPTILIIGGFLYFRFQSSDLTSPDSTKESENIEEPQEVPKTLPDGSLEDRVKTLEKEVGTINTKTTSSSQPQSDNPLDSRIEALEAAVISLNSKVSNLEKATPQMVSSSQTTVYIPLGSGGYWGNTDWYSLAEYEISLDPSNYPGYKGMQLEVIFRLAEAVGTGYVRLFNVTDNSAVSGELSTTSTTYGLKTTSSFTLSSGSKTYKLQIKSSQGKDLYIQSARIKVNF